MQNDDEDGQDTENDDDDQILSDDCNQEGNAETINLAKNPKNTKVITFSRSYGLRDDWLHRGCSLLDMDMFHYARYIERTEIPSSGTAEAFHNRVGVFFLFDKHYPMSQQYVQTIRPQAKLPQNVGPHLIRSDVNNGEDNAMWKAFWHSPLQCPGRSECTNPLLCRHVLFPSNDEDKNRNCAKKFAPAWKAQRAFIEILADRAERKLQVAQRIGSNCSLLCRTSKQKVSN